MTVSDRGKHCEDNTLKSRASLGSHSVPGTFWRGDIQAETRKLERSRGDVQKKEHFRQRQEPEQRPWNGNKLHSFGGLQHGQCRKAHGRSRGQMGR